MFASELRMHRIEGMKSSRWRWHLDEMFVRISGKRHNLWRAVDHEGEGPERMSLILVAFASAGIRTASHA